MKSLAIFLSLVSIPTIAAAQQPTTQPAPTQRVTVQFVTGPERKPVSYEMGEKGVPLFRVRVEGQEVWAMLDNGAGRTVVDIGLARSLGLDPAPSLEPFETPTGPVEKWTISQAAIDIPGQMSMRAPVSAIDLTALSQLIGRPVSLIVGKEYFDNLEVVVQPANHQILFAPSGGVQLPASTPYLPIEGEYPKVALTIGGEPLTLGIDLGANGDVKLGSEAWSRLGLDRSPTTEGHSANAAGRATTRISTMVDDVVIGSTSLDGVEVSLGTIFAGQGDGIIGFGLLSRFIFALDVKARRLWLLAPLTPAASAAATAGTAP